MFYVESERMNKKGMGMLTEDIQKQWEGEIVEKEDGVEKVHGMEKKDGSCEGERQSCGCHQKTTPRSDESLSSAEISLFSVSVRARATPLNV